MKRDFHRQIVGPWNEEARALTVAYRKHRGRR